MSKRNKLIALDLEEEMKAHTETPKAKFRNIVGKKPYIKYRNQNQKEYANMINDKEVTICVGPAGTGKSMIKLSKVLDLLWKEDNTYENIVIIKPVVEAGENLGFLPGEKEDKLLPYAYSSIYLLEKMIGELETKKLLEAGIIKLQALAYIRGVNFDNSIIVLEEAQNTTITQMKTLLTRLGEGSKMVVSGDLEQSDRYEEKDIDKSGLFKAIRVARHIDEIGLFKFGVDDVVRNPLVGKIINGFNEII